MPDDDRASGRYSGLYEIPDPAPLGGLPNQESAVRLREYLQLRSRQLRVDLEAASLFVGATETGTIAEDAIRRFLASVLPARYSVGLGEVISTRGGARQTQTKDVIIYDSLYSPVFGWGDTGFHLFPIESVYAVIEVKKSMDTTELARAMRQATEARLVAGRGTGRPFTAVVAFEAETRTETLARSIARQPVEERVDFVLVLNPKLPPSSVQSADAHSESDYVAHWYYQEPGRGGGTIYFVTSQVAASEAAELAWEDPASDEASASAIPHVYLTWGRSQHALMWFYLFLVSSINSMQTQQPNLWDYAQAASINLGYSEDSSGW